MSTVVKVGFSRGHSKTAALICAVTNSNVSHSFFYVKDTNGEWVYEAVPFGFRRVPWTDYIGHNQVLDLVEMHWPHREVSAMLDGMVGQPYALVAIFGMFVLLLFKRRPRSTFFKRGIDCVKSVTKVMSAFGHNPGNVVTPGELHDQLTRRD